MHARLVSKPFIPTNPNAFSLGNTELRLTDNITKFGIFGRKKAGSAGRRTIRHRVNSCCRQTRANVALVRRQRLWDQSGDLSNGRFLVHLKRSGEFRAGAAQGVNSENSCDFGNGILINALVTGVFFSLHCP